MGRKMVGPKNDDDDNQNVYLKCAPGNTFGAALVPRPLSPPVMTLARATTFYLADFLYGTENPILFAFSLTANNKTEI